MANLSEYKVTVLNGDLAGHSFILDHETTTIGRNAANDVCLPLDPRISRWHAQIRIAPDGAVLEDRNSGNGTWVGTTRIYSPLALVPGAQFRVGQTWLQLERTQPYAGVIEDVSSQVILLDEQEAAAEAQVDAAESIVFSMGQEPAATHIDAEELRRRLHAFELVSTALGSSLDLQTVLVTLVDTVMQVMKADRGFLLLVDPDTGEPVPRVARPPLDSDQGSIQISRHIVDKALSERVAIVTSDAMQDQRFRDVESVVGFQIRSAVCVPMYRSDRNLGVLYLDTTSRSSVFSEADVEMLTGLANQASVAMENARLYTDLRRAYDDLRAAQEQLLATERLSTIGAISASIAHDMGNVVTPVMPLVRLLLETGNPDEELAETTERQLARLSAFVERLRSFSAPTTIEKEPVDVNEIVEQTLGLVQTEANHRGVSIARDLAPDLPRVLGDPRELDRVFLNIALNAIQAVPEKTGELVVRTEEDNGDVTVGFIDNGPGIPDEVLPHLFEPLFTTKESGTGLGLFSCKRIVEDEHNGSIEVDTRPGEGTSITVRLAATNRTATTDSPTGGADV